MTAPAIRPPGPHRTTTVIRGDHRISADPGEVLTTVLGSCVAACLHDPRSGLGGMNHFLLPEGGAGRADPTPYGLHAMELLINGLLKQGASRSRLVAKVFGGARMREGLGDIGAANATFARRFLADEGIACVTASLGGERARRVRFWPATGRAQQMFLDRVEPADAAPPRQRHEDVTFF